ncbi:MAG: DUF3426 domain-containing protein [Pseudomonadales bacterium]|nr:DUF3426 domain-containing protein [Pseudomonadales bacterium]
MSLFITQCPYCHTAFRTSISQLQSADGMVRCGACLRVFAADDNLLPSADLRTVSRPMIEEEEDDIASEEHEEQMEIEALDPDDEETPEPDLADDSIFTLDLADSVPNRVSPSISEHGSFWEIVDEDTLEAIPRKPEQEQSDESDSVADEDASQDPGACGNDDEETPFDSGADSLDEDEAGVEDEDEDEDDSLSREHEAEEDEWEPSVTASPDDEFEDTPETEPDEDLPASQPPRAARENEDAAARSRMRALRFDDDMLDDRSHVPALSDDDIDHVSEADTPLEFAWQETAHGKRRVLFTSLSLLLLLCLGAQWLWFNRDTLSQNPRWRPLMDQVCSLAHCSLPPLVDIRTIHSETLEVRSHPDISNALSVHFVFRNDAAFAQPFPGLYLRFTDANDAVVAERRFKPQEYLPDGVARMGSMPPGTPVQVSLAILDPGPRAVNYEVSFYPVNP